MKHSVFRALRTFCKWLSITYNLPNPYHDERGNSVIEAPKIPQKVLYTLDLDTTMQLIEYAQGSRNKALISLLAQSGARRSEVANIQCDDLNLEGRRIKVLGKGNKEGYLIFGSRTQQLLQEYVEEYQPEGSLFGLTTYGIQALS